jgi:hypothetical protein
MFIIYILKKKHETTTGKRGVGRIEDVSQRAVKPNFPTTEVYRKTEQTTR